MTKLTFHGAAKTVTGSNFLLEEDGTRILIDCGIYQGSESAEERNRDPFKYDPKTIDAVVITHAHADHMGRVPKLVKEGFRGDIISTNPTKDFAQPLLSDSVHILTELAKEKDVDPPYSYQDVDRTLRQWRGHQYHEVINIKGTEIEFYNAGHILGSAFIRIRTKNGVRIVFSGDVGNMPNTILADREPLPETDYLVTEALYGSRTHDVETPRKEQLANAMTETIQNGGTLMIPAFSMERTQELLYELEGLLKKGEVPNVPIYMDSPLAINLLDVYKKYSHRKEHFNKRALEFMEDDAFSFPQLRLTLDRSKSFEINEDDDPKVIIAGSGMSEGGRIMYHQQKYLPDPNSCMLIVGYQADETRGREILEGAKHVEILGNYIPVKAKIRNIEGYSAHADQDQLLEWIKPLKDGLRSVFLVHGEVEAMAPFQERLKEKLHIHAEIPGDGETVELHPR